MATATVTVSSTTTTTTKVSPNIHFDPSVIRTFPGILKVLQIVISLIGFICSQVSPLSAYYSAAGWYAFVSMTAFWVTLILLILYLFHIIEKLHVVPWLMGEFGYCALWTVFYFIAAVVAATKASEDGSWGAAAFFGFAAMVLYGYDAFDKFKGWRSGGIAQGERTTSSTTATSTSANPNYPAY